MPLTWRNVEAPDFRPSMQGYETFSNLLGNAFGAAERGLERYDRTISDRVNTAFQLQLAGAQDADAARALTAAASADPGAYRLSGQSLGLAMSRPGTLISEALNQTAMEREKYQFGRIQKDDAARDAAAPLLAGGYAAARQGQTAFDAYMKANPTLGALPYAEANSFLGKALETEQTGVNIAGQRQNQSFAAENQKWTREDRDLAKAVDNFAASIGLNSFDGDSALTLLNQNAGKMPSRVYNLLRQQIMGGAYGATGGEAGAMISGALGGGSSGGDPTRVITSGGSGNLGIGSVPQSVQTLGQAVQFGKSLNRRGQESSAMGMYQITQSTMEEFAPKALGADWANKPFDAQSQDKVAEAIFNSSRGSATALRNRWVSLTPQQAEAVRKMPWQQARQVIARGESSSNPAAILADAASLAMARGTVDIGVTNANMQRNAGTINTTYMKSAQDNRPTAEVAGEAVKSDAFKGVTMAEMTQKISQIQALARSKGVTINAAVARDIAAQSNTSTWASRNLYSWMGGGDGQGMKLDEGKVREQIDAYAKGGVDRGVVANNNAQVRTAQIDNLQAVNQKAQQRLQQALMARARGQNIDISQVQAQAVQANMALQAALGQTGDDSGFTTFRAPPVRATPPPVVQNRRFFDGTGPRALGK